MEGQTSNSTIMKICLTAPVFITKQEHIKYLNETTNSFYSEKHEMLFVPVENHIENSFIPLAYHFIQEPKEIRILQGGEPQSVARAWNIGIQEGILSHAEYILVINTDIVFKKNAIDRLVDFAESHPEAVMWTMSEWADLGALEEATEDEGYNEHPHFSCFMVKHDFFRHVGKFDENFTPAYCEDGDMHARLALANKKAYTYGGARFFHFGSRTIKSDRLLWDKNKVTFPKNQQYFLDKWGVPPVNEVDEMRKVYYKTPYNSGKPLSFWK